MVGLVIAAHGRLAQELVSTAEQIVGPLASVQALSVEPGLSAEALHDRIRDAVESLDDGHGVLVLADLLGGSPCTQSLTLCRTGKVEVLTGVNLPMLLKANSLRETPRPLTELAHELAQHAQRNICCASDLLPPGKTSAA